MVKVYFDGIELLDEGIIGLSQEYKIFEKNFYLGATPCRSIHLEIEKDYFLFIPKVVKITQDDKDYATLHIDSCELVDNAFYKLELSDAMTLLNEKYDASSLIEAGTTTLGDIVNNICSKYGITLEMANFYGSDKIITWADSERSARTYIGYVAELNGGYAIINNKGNLEFKKFSNETDKEILVEDCEDIVIGDKHIISRVVYDIGTNKWEKGTENATKIKNGTQIETSDSADAEVVNYKQYGYTKQNVYSGKQLYDVNDYSGTQYGLKDEDDWITLSYDNTDGTAIKYINWMTLPSEKLTPDTQYAIIVEVKAVSGDAYVNICGTQSNALAQFTPGYQLQFANLTPGVYKKVLTTISADKTAVSMLRTFATFIAGASGSITFRLSVIEDTTITTDNFKYEPYVGGKASPSPDYPQEIKVGRGKNLFNKDLYTYDYVTQNNTGNVGDYKNIPIYVEKPNTTYYISTNFLNGYTPYGKDYLYVLIGNSATSNSPWLAIGHTGVQPGHSYYSNTITSDADGYLYLRVYKNLSKTLYEELMANVEVQIEEGDKKTSYLPYNTIEAKSTGKNKLGYTEDFNITTNGVVITGSKGIYTINGTATSGTAMSRMSIQPYTIQEGDYLHLGNDKISVSATLNLIFNDGTSVAPVYAPLNRIYDLKDCVGKTINSMTLWAGKNTTIDNMTVKPMIVNSNVATEFEPYKESSIHYHLGDNFLADKDYIENGVLNKHIGKVVLNGSENWLENSASKGLFQITLSNVYYNNTTINALSDKLIGTTGTIITTSNYYINNSVATYSNNRLFFRFDEFAENLDGLKAWLKENPVTVYYELETPEQIQLETTGELRTFEPNTIITNDLDSEMEVEYETQTKGDTLYVDNDNVYITEEADIENIHNNINGFEFYSLSTQNAPDANALVGETINFVLDNEVYPTINQINKTYNGGWLGGYEFNIDSIEVQETEIVDNETNIKNIKSRLNRDEAQLEIVAENTKTLKDNYGDMYTKAEINELILNAESGLTNTFIRSGGNNIFRNTGLWFETNEEENPFEFWTGIAKKERNDNAISKSSILLQKGTFEQDQETANGTYSVSFKYKKLVSLSNVKVIINNVSYNLTSLEDTEFYTGEKDENDNYIINPLEITSNHINIKFETDTNNSAIIYDLMVNAGSERVIWTQNENETTTNTVNISKGITITSSDLDVKFKANADGIRTLDNNDERLTEFTDKGMLTKEATIENKANVVGILRQRVGNQVWDSFVG